VEDDAKQGQVVIQDYTLPTFKKKNKQGRGVSRKISKIQAHGCVKTQSGKSCRLAMSKEKSTYSRLHNGLHNDFLKNVFGLV
jgi:hypothetical protein